MLITGIRREDTIPEFMFNLQATRHDTRRALISCTAFFTELFNSITTIINNLYWTSTLDVWAIWPGMKKQIFDYYKVLHDGDFLVHLQPDKVVSILLHQYETTTTKIVREMTVLFHCLIQLVDINRSLFLMQCRTRLVYKALFADVLFDRNGDDDEYPLRRILHAIQYILKVYEGEVMPFEADTSISFNILTDIFGAINGMIGHYDTKTRMRYVLTALDYHFYAFRIL